MYDLGFGIKLDFTSVVVFLLVSMPGVMPCGNGSSTVVRMCYNNSITFDSVGFATTEGTADFQDCTCRLTTDGAVTRLKVGLFSHKDNCSESKITLRPFDSTFGTTMTCGTKQTPTIVSLNSTSGLNQDYKRNEDDKMCLQYSVDTGWGTIVISCSGDDLPSATTTKSVQTTEFTAKGSPVTSSSDKSSLNTASSSLNETASNETPTEVSTGGTSTISDHTSTRSSTSIPKPDTSNENKNGIIAAVVVSSIVFIVLVVLLVVCLERKRRSKQSSSITKEGVSTLENPYFVSNGGPYSIYAEVTEMSPSTNVDENKSDEVKLKERVKENGTSDEDISYLYATVDRSKKADTLF